MTLPLSLSDPKKAIGMMRSRVNLKNLAQLGYLKVIDLVQPKSWLLGLMTLEMASLVMTVPRSWQPKMTMLTSKLKLMRTVMSMVFASLKQQQS
jgi:hypothetical protein